MDDTRRPRLAARALGICLLLALVAASVLGVALPADEAAAQPTAGRNFRLTDQGGGQVRLDWNAGTSPTNFNLNRITASGTVAIATNLSASTTNFTDSLGTSITVACYQLEIRSGTTVTGTSDILCAIVNAGGGASPARNVGIRTNESPLVTITWSAPSAGTPIAYLVVPLGASPLPPVPATATLQAVDAPGGVRCYIVLTLIADGTAFGFQIGGFSDVVCAVPGVFTPPPAPTATPTRTNTPLPPTFTATAVPTSTFTATATSTPPPTATPTVTNTLTPIDLTVSKTDTPDPVNPGQQVTYTITVTNNGQTPASNVTVTDSLPAGLTFGSAAGEAGSNFVCNETAPPGTVVCTGGSIPGGQSRTITLVAIVDNPCVVISPVTNQVTVDPSNTIAESNETNNTATQSTTINGCVQATSTPTVTRTRTPTPTVTNTPLPPTVTVTPSVDLSVFKVDNPDPVVPPSSLQYTIVVQNTGTVGANNVTVVDTLDPAIFFGDFTFGSASGDQGFICNYDFAQTVTCTGGNIGPGGGATITIVLNFNFCGQTYYNNVVVVDPANTIAEFNENNNQNFAQTGCGSGVATATPLTLTTTPTPTRTPTRTPTTVPTASFNFVKLDAPDPVVSGGSITYTLQLTNTGSATVSGITLNDNLAAEVTFISVTVNSGGFTCNLTTPPGFPNGVVSCANGSIAPGETAEIVIVVSVTTCVSPIVNTATIVSPVVANNTASASTTVSGCPTKTPTPTVTSTPTNTPTNTPTATATVVPTLDISVSKTTTGFTPATGDLFSYVATISVTGTGTASWPAGVLSFRDTLPAQVSFIGPVTNTYGATCSFVAGPPARVECTGGSIAAGGSGTVTIPVRLDACGTVTNIAEADPNNAITETNEGNNLATDVRTNVCDTSLTKTANGAADTAVNTSGGPASVTYVITLTDVATGQTVVAPSTVTDTLPAGFTVTAGPTISAGDTGTCSVSGTPQVITCTGVGGPEPVTITYTASVATSVARGDYANSASVTTPADSVPGNNADTATVSVYPFDLSVSVVDTDDPVFDPQQYAYQVTVTNTSAGGFTASSFFVSGGLVLRTPPGGPGSSVGSASAYADVVSVSSANPGVSCAFPNNPDAADQRYACLISSLPAGQSVVITVVVNTDAAEDDATAEAVSLDATLNRLNPSPCAGGGTNPSGLCAPEAPAVALTSPPPSAMLTNNRDVEFTDID